MTVTSLAGPSMLFCPADRPDRYSKALQRADSTIIDLEDAVSPSRKTAARHSFRTWCDDPRNRPYLEADPGRVAVRINSTTSEYFAEDIELLRTGSVTTVMLPKTESMEDVELLIEQLPGVSIIALCETPKGIAHSLEIAQHPAVLALMWGAEDLLATLGGSSSRLPDGSYRDVAKVARATVLLNAVANGKSAIDSIYADFSDGEGLFEESRDAAGSGFTQKACIHPDQCDVVRRAYLPAPEEVDRARKLLEAVRDSRGAARFQGMMVDEPLIRHAERVLQLAGDLER